MIRQGRLIVLLSLSTLSSSFLIGCGKPSIPRWPSFPVEIYTQASVVSTAAAEADFDDALEFWESKAGHKLFEYKGTWTGEATPFTGNPERPDAILGNVVFNQNPWPLKENLIGWTAVTSTDNEFQKGMIMLNPNTEHCFGDCIGQDQLASLRKLFAHELGHFLGLEHVENPSNIMNTKITPGGSLSDVEFDQEKLLELTQ